MMDTVVTTQQAWLDRLLSEVKRRYRIPEQPTLTGPWAAHPSSQLALILDRVERSLELGEPIAPTVKEAFVNALATLIQEAAGSEEGDAAFQALVLQHQSETVREFLALKRLANDDSRTIHTAVNRYAHPQKLLRMEAGALRDDLLRLQQHAVHRAWTLFIVEAQTLLSTHASSHARPVCQMLQALLNGPELPRLQRLDALSATEVVQHYVSLKEAQGPQAGSASAFQQGLAAKRRGVAVEKRTAKVLNTIADRLNAWP
jgi:hypothetical protein